MSKQFPGVDIDAVHGGRMPKTEPTADAKLLTDEEIAAAWNSATGTRATESLGDLYLHYMRAVAQAQLAKCESSPRYVLPGQWIDAKERPPEHFPVLAWDGHYNGPCLADSRQMFKSWSCTHWIPIPDRPQTISLPRP